MSNMYDVAIIGGGVSGTALLYELAQFTNLKKLVLFEKYPSIAAVNSHARNNSQTLHCGDIETNYTLEKAIQVRDTAKMVVNYTESYNETDEILHRYSKMVLAVGDEECRRLKARYESFYPHFPDMQWLDSNHINDIEPAVCRQRNEKINAIGVQDQFTAVDYQKLSVSFVKNAIKNKSKRVDVKLGTQVFKIKKEKDIYRIFTKPGQSIKAKFVVVSAGGHSLLFAQRMGYGLEFACLPVAGSFYYTPPLLNGKVYTMQNDKLPFAAIHGDPDLLVSNKTRIGPTALMLPLLERYNWKTFLDFLKVFKLERKVLKVFMDLFSDKDIRHYMLKNILFEVPLVRKQLFLKDAQKIIPSLSVQDLSFAKRIGGIRPIMIDKEKSCLHLGEAQINPGNGILFNMTPSPGATSCLGNAQKDLNIIVDYLGADFHSSSFSEQLIVSR